ncbi:dihydroneopterin aldolase [Prevotella bivia]|uniref:dihydroneopterin aldolase n=1 Tax=Prevotella bivia TaxID=28125 RepID=UPI002582D30A|nr:dihydroneopterin aldolase [Prevotella bivia]
MFLKQSFIHLHNLCFHAYIGVAEQERIVGNDYVVDLKLKVDIAKAMLSDDVQDTISYAEVYEVIREVMMSPCLLLEYAAGRIGKALFNRFPTMEAITVLLTKKNPPMGADCSGASVEITLINEKSIVDGVVSAENE